MVQTTNTSDWQKGYVQVVAKAWSDDTYKDELLRDPRAVLADAGLEVPSSFEIAVVEDSADKKHFVLPAKPAEGEISEEALAGAAGGWCSNPNRGACCACVGSCAS